jgi:hypothetical protein
VINLDKLRSHAIGALAVGFAASIATLIIGYMAKIGPPVFNHLMVGLGAFTLLCVAAGLLMGAIVIYKRTST